MIRVLVMKLDSPVKPKFTREIFNHNVGAYRIRRGPKPRYSRRRFQFSKAGFASLRLPGTLGSTVFTAAYYIALICQVPTLPARKDQELATYISVYANLLMLTPSFRRLNKKTRERYQYLIEDFCSRIAGKPVLLARHRITASFIYRNRSPAYVERRIAMVRTLLVKASRMEVHPVIVPSEVGLIEWAEARAKTKREARRRQQMERSVRVALAEIGRKAAAKADTSATKMVVRTAPLRRSSTLSDARKLIDRHSKRIMSDPQAGALKGFNDRPDNVIG